MEPMYPHAPFLNQMLLSFVQLAEENILIFSLCLPKRSEKLGKETVPSSRLSFFFIFKEISLKAELHALGWLCFQKLCPLH